MTTFLELANRFRTHTFNKPEGESHTLWYKDDSSVGNRYRRWQAIDAKRDAEEGDNVIDMEKVYDYTKYSGCDWSYIFDQIHYGLITGPKTLAAVEECLDILKNDNPPEDDGTKVRHVNRLGGVNYLPKPTYHDWNLTDRIGKILSTAFFADQKDKNLYSEDFVYVYTSHSGWNRSC
jgi:hypothetical protein